MGILIKDTDMPESCEDCPLCVAYNNGEFWKCGITNNEVTDLFLCRATECPLEEVGNGECRHVLEGKNIFIIGSLSREKRIEETAKFLRSIGYNVDHVRKQPDKDFTTMVYEAFQKISEADSIVVVQKEEGGLGEGTTYEVAFARFIGKKVYIFQN